VISFKAEIDNGNLNINDEFKSLIPNLAQEELRSLEESILKDGCTDPIITWNNYIIDGHNRYAICSRHDINFNVMEANDLQDELEVKMWIIKRQFGRRNLTTFQKSELALCYEKVESERSKKRQLAGKRPINKDLAQDFGQRENAEEKGRSLELAAKKAGISDETVRKVKKILDSGNDELKEKVRENRMSIDKAFRQILLLTLSMSSTESSVTCDIKSIEKPLASMVFAICIFSSALPSALPS
jgi:hypothetical protein